MRTLKFLITPVLAAVAVAAFAILPSRLCFKGGNGYTFYCGTSSSDCREVTVSENAALTRLSLSNVCGEATTFDADCFDLDEFLGSVNGKIVFLEELSDSVNYYCTADLPYSVNLYQSEINLHVSVRKDGVKVASPIIFGGY